MRYLKRLLVCLYAYDAVFFAVVVMLNCAGITVQDSAVAGVAAATGVESIIGGIIKVREAADERRRIKLEHDIEKEKE